MAPVRGVLEHVATGRGCVFLLWARRRFVVANPPHRSASDLRSPQVLNGQPTHHWRAPANPLVTLAEPQPNERARFLCPKAPGSTQTCLTVILGDGDGAS